MTLEQKIGNMYCPDCGNKGNIEYKYSRIEQYVGIKIPYDYYQCNFCGIVKEQYIFKLYTLKRFVEENKKI